MERRTADIIVKIFAVLAILAGIGMLFGAFGAFRGATSLGITVPGLSQESARTGLGIAGVVAIVIGLLYLLVGWGLWTHKNWARITILVLAWIGAISALLSLVGLGAATTGRAVITTSAIVSLIIAALEIWFFQFNNTTRSLFGVSRTETASARPVAGKR